MANIPLWQFNTSN